MNIFEIHSIKFGWFEVCFSPHKDSFFLIGSDYLGCDSPKLFLGALADIYENKASEKLVCWQDEPGVCMLQLEISGDLITVEVFGTDRDAFELPDLGDGLKKYMDQRLFQGSFDAVEFLDEVITGFSLYESGSGLSLYEKHWMDFPKAELERLKKSAAELNKKMGKLDEMFCLSY